MSFPRPYAWVASWDLWRSPARVVRYVLVVEVAALAGVVGAATAVPARPSDLPRFLILALCAAVTIWLTRGVERQRDRVRPAPVAHVDGTGLWSFAAVLVLPPLLASAMVVLTCTLPWWWRAWPRQRPLVPYRCVFSCATVLIGTQAAALVLSLGMAEYPGLPQSALLPGLRDLAVVAVAAAVRWGLNCGLVMVAIALSQPVRSVRDLFADFSEQLLEAGAMGLGLAVAVLVVVNPVALVGIVLSLGVMHRGLLVRQYQQAARTDAKTGLATVGWWRQVAGRALERAEAGGDAVGVLVLDIDHFKRVNDTYGHLAGDVVLAAVAATLRAETRGDDTCCRFGGEEFAVLIPGVDGAGELREIAERVRRRVELLEVDLPTGGAPRRVGGITVSLGGAVYPGGGLATLDDVLLAADAAVYSAKRSGRNRTCLRPDVAPA
ncbi:diguanylate cyclase (GGDEF) domain-containing protein [Amycolatopsis arida]|uniref:Diguanylate cyclase (GGDEF) domain-containing protein n=1 Tax=Amycolatopsis arida TaxID=587909 RepID=A0A1I5SNX8_9PSEU|nr:GGDEF domain-containing protein [Amycolatopsis arida]TDX96406.1 diguanylate cyclase (GGDEF)-like protein [Amycolatopsis arida]SFP72460.1 diguanylate cyclase (GGDEF) domain-containing protein [Amycolatopsis arida]